MRPDDFFGLTDQGVRVAAQLSEEGDVITLRIPKETVPLCAFLDVHAPIFEAEAGEEGYFMSGSMGRRGYLCYFRERPDAENVTTEVVIPLLGAKRRFGTFLAVPEGMVYDMAFVLTLKDGHYFLGQRVRLAGDAPYEDIVVRYYRLADEADYNDMAKLYRKQLLDAGKVRTIREREKDYPALSYAADAPEIRIRMGWKEAPSPVPEQTEDNEPPMHVACTFRDVERLIDALIDRGVEKAELCLVGWNKSGHDGRWPTAFPVEPLLGGEEALRHLIAYAKEKGYQIVCHTNSTDAYAISPYFKEDILALDEKQETASAGVWSGGQGRRVCPKEAERIALKELPRVADLGFYGLHYIDVMAVIPPTKCCNAAHPVNRRQAVMHYHRIMKLCRTLFGGFASEGAYDFACPYVDYGFYVCQGQVNHPLFDVEIPVWHLVYHGIVLAGASTETVNVNVRDTDSQLYFEEMGGRLSYYIYQKFLSGAHANWLGKDDLTLDGEKLFRTADIIAEGVSRYRPLTRLQKETMERYDILSPEVRGILYGDGTYLVVNKGDDAFSYNGRSIPKKSCVYL